MKHNELYNQALMTSLEHHLSNVDELVNYDENDVELFTPLTAKEVMELVEKNNPRVIVWEAYEDYDHYSIANAIYNLAMVLEVDYEHILKEVNGQEWYDNWKLDTPPH